MITREEYIKSIFKIYSLVKVLSEKNGCKVLQLRHKSIGKDIVLHSFPQKSEAYEKLITIKNENLPEIFDIIECCDGQIILEEFIEGLTVAQIMETGKYKYSGAKKVIVAVCSSLEILHGMNIVHRDIKPENIIIDKSGRVVLIDFNASRTVKTASRDTVVMGTVGYASPEQLGIAQTDARTDIYALGVLLNVMLTGKHPSEILAKGKAGKIVNNCTAINPDIRYKSALQLAKKL